MDRSILAVSAAYQNNLVTSQVVQCLRTKAAQKYDSCRDRVKVPTAEYTLSVYAYLLRDRRMRTKRGSWRNAPFTPRSFFQPRFQGLS